MKSSSVFPGSEENPIQADIKIKKKKNHPNKPSPLCNSLHNLGFVQSRICGKLNVAPCITSTQIPFILSASQGKLPHSHPKARCQFPHSQGWSGMDPPKESTAFPFGKNNPRESPTSTCCTRATCSQPWRWERPGILLHLWICSSAPAPFAFPGRKGVGRQVMIKAQRD